MSETVLKTRYTGLREEEVLKSRLEHGENRMTPPKRQPWWKLLFAKFDDPVIRILIIAALISMCTGEWIEGTGIIIAILLATVLAFLNEFKAEKEFDVLNRVSDDVPVKVIRDSKFRTVPKWELVVGDILFVELGEEVPADGIVLEAVNLQADQSKLTGESDPVRKISEEEAAANPHGEETYPVYMLLRGSPVVDGHGYVRIVAVGDRSEIGKTAAAAVEETEGETPLNEQLGRLSRLIGVVGFSAAAITFGALVVHGYFIGEIQQATGQWLISGVLLVALLTALSRIWLPVLFDGVEFLSGKNRMPAWLASGGTREWMLSLGAGVLILLCGAGLLYFGGTVSGKVSGWIAPEALSQFIKFFMVAVTLIVVTVPEGLAMSVTLSLAYSMRKMTAANNLVRKMHACETIGAATVICTDKTGTLTMNQMRVQEAVFPLAPPAFSALAVAVNSTANLSLVDPNDPQPIGNPTEGALLLWLHKQGFDYELLREKFRITTQWTFSTERKFMATKGFSEGSATEILFAKGAPEILLKRCTYFETKNGSQTLSDGDRAEIHRELLSYQARGMRTLGFACLYNPSDKSDVLEAAQGMTWMGFAAIADPVRADVPAAVDACRKAGIQVKMVTGDNPETAREIGRKIHLWDDAAVSKYSLLTGVEFAALSDAEALSASKEVKIMARARPNDKLRLVKCLKAQGEIVAVTGDGTNDAPALNNSDVGIAMGKTGTAIAKEASDIILLDDSFSSIVNAVMWGRSLYRNIQKFILFQLTVNVAALSIAMTGPFIGVELPLTVIQMLWINLIMDTFAALALATDPPDPAVMNLPPRRNTAFIVTPRMWAGILGVAAIFVTAMLSMLFWMKHSNHGSDMRWLTILFCVFVLLQFWNLFNAKCFGSNDSAFKHLFDNKAFLLIATAILVMQIVFVQFGGKIFRTAPLSMADWVLILVFTSLIFWGGEVFRAVNRFLAASDRP